MPEWIDWIRTGLRQRFCRHDFEKKAFFEAEENNVLYSVRRYVCTKCGKAVYVDGRRDPYEPKER